MIVDNCFYANETAAAAASGALSDIAFKHGPAAPWVVTGADERALRSFSATCFYTALHLKQGVPSLRDTPIGLVQSSVGGTTIESWMSAAALAAAGVAPENATCGFKGGCGGQAYCGNYDNLIVPLAPTVFKAMAWYQVRRRRAPAGRAVSHCAASR